MTVGCLVGVLPHPGARGIGRAEGLRHGLPEDRGIGRPAGLHDRQQGPGRREHGIGRGRAVRRCGRVDGGGRQGRTRKRVRRRMGVEHGDLRPGIEMNRRRAGARHGFSRAAPPGCSEQAGRTPAGGEQGEGRSEGGAVPRSTGGEKAYCSLFVLMRVSAHGRRPPRRLNRRTQGPGAAGRPEVHGRDGAQEGAAVLAAKAFSGRP